MTKNPASQELVVKMNRNLHLKAFSGVFFFVFCVADKKTMKGIRPINPIFFNRPVLYNLVL